jgi:hypothetical protein
MGTLIPAFPKGLCGISPVPPEALTGWQKGPIIDPAPAMPAAFKNARRVQLLFLMFIGDFPRTNKK